MEENTQKVKQKRPGRKKSTTPVPNRNGNNPKASSKLKELWADPVWAAAQREKMRLAGEKRRGVGVRTNVPDGMRKDEAHAKLAAANESAKEIVKIMIKNGIVDGEDTRATEALEFNITIMRGPHGVRERLAAASKILEYTKSKPAAKSEVTVNKAEDWLAQVAASENNDKEDDGPAQDA